MESLATFTTAPSPRTGDKGVTIDRVYYPFALGDAMPAEDLDHLTRMMVWIGYEAQLGKAADVALDGGELQLPDRPADYPPTRVLFDAALLHLVTVVLPTAPPDILAELDRPKWIGVLGHFLAMQRAMRSRPSSAATSRKVAASTSRNSRRSTTATRRTGK